jgi:flagellar basal body-associated protein FliL
LARSLPHGNRLESLARFLIALLIVLILVILGVTFYAIIRGPVEGAEGGLPAAGSTGGSSAGGIGAEGIDDRSPRAIAVFTGIGRLRIPAGGSFRITVVLSVVFPYPAEDRPFTEELTGKIPLFRRILRDYFGSLPPEELNPLNEEKIKAELLERFNSELRLGSIGVLFFNEFMILE